MKIDRERVGLVRGKITVKQDRGSFEPITAYTMWYRHDAPNLEEDLNRAVDKLVNVYQGMIETHSSGYKMKMWASMSIEIEWRDYRK